MRCPVCGEDAGVYYWPSALELLVIDVLDMELYQRSYPGKAKYISPRCEQCYDEAVRRRKK